MKRIFGVLLSAVLCFSSFPVTKADTSYEGLYNVALGKPAYSDYFDNRI